MVKAVVNCAITGQKSVKAEVLDQRKNYLMSFAYRLNTEFIYYQQSIAYLKKALITYSEREYELGYRSSFSKKKRLFLPSTKQGVSYAIMSIICMACYVESTLNLALTEHFRKQPCRNKDKEEKILNRSIRKKKKLINGIYNGVISCSLNKNLTSLSDSRNQLVHSAEEKGFLGDLYLSEYYAILERKNMLLFAATVKRMAILFSPIIGTDVRQSNNSYIGDGDFVFYSEVSWREKCNYVFHHPIWYILKRVPLKIWGKIELLFKSSKINKVCRKLYI